ncbi:MAG: bifunctional alpha/beta hydrolase/OsmC family protein [Mangrovicoccus sp.]|nr:bifunctional alpha/beta hydrolase/OsmC family protein [Mangrovicoccus sp.]
MPTERFTFDSPNGVALAARLDLPASGAPLATALFAHCFTCGKDIAAARRIAGRLAAMGIAVLRFDFTGLGHSEGEFANTSFTTNVQDLVAAAEALKSRGMGPDLLIGHSLGGAAVLRAAESIPSARAVVTIGTPADPGHVTDNFTAALPEIAAKGAADVMLGGRPIRIGQGFVEDVSNARLTGAIAKLNRPLLVLHAPRDEIVGIDNATAIFKAARHPKSFITLRDADHLLSNADDADYAAEVIAAWAGLHGGIKTPAPPPGAPEGVVRVSEADVEGFLQDISAGPKHHALADEPLAYGGTDKGMSPYGFLAAGLGACTSMTIRMYARRKGWPLDGVSVDVTHNKVHAQDADETNQSERIDAFHREIRLEGSLDAEQRARLLGIADRCPVHRTLEASSRITTALAE